MSVALLAARPRHRPGGWTPKELGTLSLWLDADDATTITISTGVSQWDDKSGNGRNVTQSTGGNQPSWTKGARNGRAVVRFDGGDHMTGGDTLDLLTAGFSAMVVAIDNGASSGTAVANMLLSKQEPTSGSTSGSYTLNRNGMTLAVTSTGRDARDTTNPTTLNLVGGVVDRQTGIVSYRNGDDIGTASGGFPDANTLNISVPFRIGGRGNTNVTSLLNGDIGEVVLSLATWTTDDRQKVEGYLAHKWGLASSLPNDHPYLSVAP